MPRSKYQLELFTSEETTVEAGTMFMRKPGHLPHNGLSPVALHEAGHIVAFEALGILWSEARIMTQGRSGYVEGTWDRDADSAGPNPKTKMLIDVAGKAAQEIGGRTGRKQPIGIYAPFGDSWHRNGLWGDANNLVDAAFELIQHVEQEARALLIQNWDHVLHWAQRLERERLVLGPAATDESSN